MCIIYLYVSPETYFLDCQPNCLYEYRSVSAGCLWYHSIASNDQAAPTKYHKIKIVGKLRHIFCQYLCKDI